MADELELLRRANPAPTDGPRYGDGPSTTTPSAGSASCCTNSLRAAAAPGSCGVSRPPRSSPRPC